MLDQFTDSAISNPETVFGGGCDCYCKLKRAKGNNGIGQEKRGIDDGTPPGLEKNEKGEFNDGPGNRHGVEVEV